MAPVIIEYPDGRQFEVASAKKAKDVHPDAAIVRVLDGTMLGKPYVEPEAPAAEAAPVEPSESPA